MGKHAQEPGAEHAGFFDFVNEKTAHCASSSVLRPGDYPVGVAFVPPNTDDERPAIFRLIYLPNPRRQMAYSYSAKADPAARLARLSRRTLDIYIAQKRLPDDNQLATLRELDAHEVSRFASRVFTTMKDGPVEVDFEQEVPFSQRPGWFGGRNSCFAAICAQLLTTGTREAAPGLVAALRQKKFRQPTPAEPYRLPWLAAFAIARRDPWPDVDAWLAENLDNPQTIALDHDQSGHRLRWATETPGTKGSLTGYSEETATIGAMAAALLARRHACRPAALGLLRTSDKQMEALKLYRYSNGKPADIERVRQWWKAHPRRPWPRPMPHRSDEDINDIRLDGDVAVRNLSTSRYSLTCDDGMQYTTAFPKSAKASQSFSFRILPASFAAVPDPLRASGPSPQRWMRSGQITHDWHDI